MESGRVEEALALYRPIAAEDPSRVNNLAFRVLGAGDPAVAVELMKLNTELHPEDANLWDTLGGGHLALGQTAAAEAAFAKVLEVMPAYKKDREPAFAAQLESRARIEIERLKGP